MVTFADVQASNKKISTLPAGLVGVFSGATAGIGEGTLKAFAKYAQEPVIFLLGRNESAASRIQNEVAHLNPGAKFHFIKVQLSLIQAIDDACNQVKALTKKVDFLCMSQGALSIDGRVGKLLPHFVLPSQAPTLTTLSIQKRPKASTPTTSAATTAACGSSTNLAAPCAPPHPLMSHWS